MAEENKPKVTLIKKPAYQTAKSASEEPVKAETASAVPVKKKVIIRKAVVGNRLTITTTPVTSAQTKAEPEKPKAQEPARESLAPRAPEPDKPAPAAQGPAATVQPKPAAAPASRPASKLVTRPNVKYGSDNIINGPKIIKGTDLPPLPPIGGERTPSSSSGARRSGTVAGRPYNNGERSQGGYRGQGYQGQGGGYQGQGSGYQGQGYQGQGGGYQGQGGGYQGQGGYRSGCQGQGGYRPSYPSNGPRPPYNPNGPRPYSPRPYNPNGPRPPFGQGGPRPFNPQQGGFRPHFQGGRPGMQGGPMAGRRPAESDSISAGKNRNRTVGNKNKDKDNRFARDEELDFEYSKAKKLEAQAAAVPRQIEILDSVTPGDLAKKMNLPVNVIIGKLMANGMQATINQPIDSETAQIVASDYNCEVKIITLYDETVIESEAENPEDLVARPPIVTVMGHVDHGKTKLLDAIRKTHVQEGEAGGITQHIGACKVITASKREIVFLDTPGHAAFTMMRARGAQLTDIVVLVVAANDGVMPQTIEAIDHARAADVPIIVAINKCDLAEAKPERVMQQLSDYNLVPEEWGGSTLFCKISALRKEGIDELLDTILLEADMLDLKASPKCRAEGKVLEAKVDPGRGNVATVIIQKGTLHQGDPFVCGVSDGTVRTMTDDKGLRIKTAGPSSPIEISGLSIIPNAGDPFQVTETEKFARQISAKRQEIERLGEAKKFKKVTLDTLYDKMKSGEMKNLNVIIKGDVQGSVEALQSALEKLSNDEVRLTVIHAAAGAIIENDINLASASESGALVIGFNVRPTPKAALLAQKEKIEIRKYSVIYEVVEDIRSAMEGLLAPEKKIVDVGRAEVRDLFKIPKVGVIAGCYITTGRVSRSNSVRVVRAGKPINDELYKITSLKHLKEDVKSVDEGWECGIGLEEFSDFEVGDTLEAVEVTYVARTFKDPAPTI